MQNISPKRILTFLLYFCIVATALLAPLFAVCKAPVGSDESYSGYSLFAQLVAGGNNGSADEQFRAVAGISAALLACGIVAFFTTFMLELHLADSFIHKLIDYIVFFVLLALAIAFAVIGSQYASAVRLEYGAAYVPAILIGVFVLAIFAIQLCVREERPSEYKAANI